MREISPNSVMNSWLVFESTYADGGSFWLLTPSGAE